MANTFRLATFNVENLFSRAKLLNFPENDDATGLLIKVDELRGELAKSIYDKDRILELKKELDEYVEIGEVRGKLFSRGKVKADGREDWSGYVRFKRDRLSDSARLNTARVIREMNSDACCLVEVESRPVLKQFCSELLPEKANSRCYPHCMLIDGNDLRGIDVGIVSRLPIRKMRSHVDDTVVDSRGKVLPVFSRDCLEVELDHPSGSIWMLLNHLKSKGYGDPKDSEEKRRRQAERIKQILGEYDLAKDRVVVAGDFNDTPDSPALAALRQMSNLYDVLKEKVSDPKDRWTYHYKSNEQIDFLLVSRPLRDALESAGVERRGIHGIEKFSGGTIKPFESVKKYTDSASDHGGIWAEFRV